MTKKSIPAITNTSIHLNQVWPVRMYCYQIRKSGVGIVALVVASTTSRALALYRSHENIPSGEAMYCQAQKVGGVRTNEAMLGHAGECGLLAKLVYGVYNGKKDKEVPVRAVATDSAPKSPRGKLAPVDKIWDSRFSAYGIYLGKHCVGAEKATSRVEAIQQFKASRGGSIDPLLKYHAKRLPIGKDSTLAVWIKKNVSIVAPAGQTETGGKVADPLDMPFPEGMKAWSIYLLSTMETVDTSVAISSRDALLQSMHIRYVSKGFMHLYGVSQLPKVRTLRELTEWYKQNNILEYTAPAPAALPSKEQEWDERYAAYAVYKGTDLLDVIRATGPRRALHGYLRYSCLLGIVNEDDYRAELVPGVRTYPAMHAWLDAREVKPTPVSKEKNTPDVQEPALIYYHVYYRKSFMLGEDLKLVAKVLAGSWEEAVEHCMASRGFGLDRDRLVVKWQTETADTIIDHIEYLGNARQELLVEPSAPITLTFGGSQIDTAQVSMLDEVQKAITVYRHLLANNPDYLNLVLNKE